MLKVLLAAFYTPGVRAIDCLLGRGLSARQLLLLTHEHERNRVLIDYARLHGISTLTAPGRSPFAASQVRAFKPDLLFSLYYRDILPASVLSLVGGAAINLHPSLLPRYRGTFSAPWAILEGETVTGFSYHLMEPRVDTGDIVYQQEVPIAPDDTAYSLYHRLIDAGMAAFPALFDTVRSGAFQARPQQGEPSYHARAVPGDGWVDTGWPRDRIDRYIRALHFPPFPGARVRLASGETRELTGLEQYDALHREGLL